MNSSVCVPVLQPNPWNFRIPVLQPKGLKSIKKCVPVLQPRNNVMKVIKAYFIHYVPVLQPWHSILSIYNPFTSSLSKHFEVCVPVSQLCVPVLKPCVPVLQPCVPVLQPCVPVLKPKTSFRSSIATLRSSIEARVPRIPVLQPVTLLKSLFFDTCVPVSQPIYITL